MGVNHRIVFAFASMMILGTGPALAQNTGAQEPPPQLLALNAVGSQASNSSPLILQGNLIGDNAVWQLKLAVQGPTFETIPRGSTFNGAACRQEYRQAQIVTPDGSSLSVEVYVTRCEPYDPSGVPSGAYTSNGAYRILGGTGRFAETSGGAGSIQFDATSDGKVLVSIHGSALTRALDWRG